MLTASLYREDGDQHAFRRLQVAFCRANPDYRIWHVRGATRVEALHDHMAVFFHEGQGEAASERATSPFGVGDVAILRPRESLCTDAPFSAVLFRLPERIGDDVPTFLRPDADPVFSDRPGGCATDPGAYRRVLLTWQPQHGPFIYRALNAHRVRMDDSLSHYHPAGRGPDELYLVQAAPPGAAIVHSDSVPRLLTPQDVRREEVPLLWRRVSVRAGDLVYIPAGEMHRGVGGIVAHVITVPGFVPGTELSLDHCLAQINERLGLQGDAAIPLHAATAHEQLVR